MYFISLVGIAGTSRTSNTKCHEIPTTELIVEEEEGLFDLYTKFYDFYQDGKSDQLVIVKTAHDIQDWFYSLKTDLKNDHSKEVSICTMVQYFIKLHSIPHLRD